MNIQNPMVIPIAIGHYDKNPINRSISENLRDLDGVRIDIDDTINLFGQKGLRYDIFPTEYHGQDKYSYKSYWDESELLDFLKKKADDLEQNLQKNDEGSPDRYDGLLVMISCHGLEGHIITSDYQCMSKTAIHRIFSGNKPSSRKIPRLFLFDCCSGTGERDVDWRAQAYDAESSSSEESEQGKTALMHLAKSTEVQDINRESSIVWVCL